MGVEVRGRFQGRRETYREGGSSEVFRRIELEDLVDTFEGGRIVEGGTEMCGKA